MKLWDRKKKFGQYYGKTTMAIPQRFRCAMSEDFGYMKVRKLFYFQTMEEAQRFVADKDIWETESFQIFDRKFKRVVRINGDKVTS